MERNEEGERTGIENGEDREWGSREDRERGWSADV